MSSIVDDLEHVTKCLDDARTSTKSAVVLLDRISAPLTSDAESAMQLLEDTYGRIRRVADVLGSL